MSKNRYRCLITWKDRKWGPQMHRTAEEASSMRRAINQALRLFFTDKTRRKERRDAHVEIAVQVAIEERHCAVNNTGNRTDLCNCGHIRAIHTGPHTRRMPTAVTANRFIKADLTTYDERAAFNAEQARMKTGHA